MILSKELIGKDSFYQNDSCGFFSTIYWLKDDFTISFFSEETKESEIRDYFSGIKLLLEPTIGIIDQGKNANTIEKTFLDKTSNIIPGFGVESNIFKSIISLQIIYVFPTSVQFDDMSDIIKLKLLNNSNKTVGVIRGFGFGLSFLNSICSIVWMKLYYDPRDFKNINENLNSSNFIYFNIQPISAVRELMKTGKKLFRK